MKTLVFSDTHLGLQFEEKRFNFLKKIISQVDQVIINGDLWDGYVISFDSFVKSQWRQLFPLLKKKKTIYIYGNHDKKIYADKRVNLFSVKQAEKIMINIKNKQFIFEHGNNISPSLADSVLPGKKIKLYSTLISDFLENIIVRFLRNKIVRSYCKKFNQNIKNKINNRTKKNQIYFFGHTHYKEIDWQNNFVNSGIIRFGIAQFIIIDNGKILPKEEWYD